MVGRKLLRGLSWENAPLRNLSAEGSQVNMAVRRMLSRNHGTAKTRTELL